MFSSSQSLGTQRPSVGAYRDIGASTSVQDASPHKMVSLLYGALSSHIAAARGGLARRDIAAKGRAISHAVRIVEVGLSAPLDMQGGGAISINLRDLYDYLVQQLTLANIRNDDAVLQQCGRLVETLREGWDGIADQAHAAPGARV